MNADSDENTVEIEGSIIHITENDADTFDTKMQNRLLDKDSPEFIFAGLISNWGIEDIWYELCVTSLKSLEPSHFIGCYNSNPDSLLKLFDFESLKSNYYQDNQAFKDYIRSADGYRRGEAISAETQTHHMWSFCPFAVVIYMKHGPSDGSTYCLGDVIKAFKFIFDIIDNEYPNTIDGDKWLSKAYKYPSINLLEPNH